MNGVGFMNNEYAAAVFKSALPVGVKQSEQEQSPNENKKDSLDISKESQRKAELARLMEEMKNADKQAEAAGESVKVMSRCIKIASRILNGDKVPLKDMKYLQENDPDMFRQAITLRRVNPEPKEYDSVLEDEENETSESGGNNRSADAHAPQNAASAPAETSAPQTTIDISC